MSEASHPLPAKKIKLMHLLYSFDVGGLERIVANCISSLPEEYEHIIVAVSNYSPSFVAQLSKPVKVISLDKPAGHSWGTYKHFYAVLRTHKPDIVHTYNFACLEYQSMSWLARVPFRVHAEHGRDVHDPDGTNVKYKWLRKIAGVFVHKFVSVSDDLHQWLINVVGLKVKKCQLIINGVDTTEYSPLESVQLSSDANDTKFVFGHVARLQLIKNQANLIEAFRLACSESKSFAERTKLVIVGGGPLLENLQSQIDRIDEALSIEMWGERHDMAYVYRQFSVFVMSSDAEGVPMTMLEAMSTGLPVVSTAVGGIPEITSQEQSILVEPNSPKALSEGLLLMFDKFNAPNNTDGGFSNMQTVSRQLVENHFSQASMVSQYQSLYEQGLNHVRN